MSEVYKTFKRGEIKLTTFPAHKLWELDYTTTGSLGVKVYDGAIITGSFNIEDPLFGDSETEELTTDPHTGQAYYRKLVYDSIAHLYYDRSDDPYHTFCNDNPKAQIRELNGEVKVISIPSNIFGEKIKPSSVQLTLGTGESLVDDGQGNLIDSTDTIGSSCISEDYNLFYCGFWDGYRKPLNQKTSMHMKREGKYHVIPKARNVYFQKSMHGRCIMLNGTQSLSTNYGNTTANPAPAGYNNDNSMVVLQGTRDWKFNDDFAISFWMKAPLSQSVTSSYVGPFLGDDSTTTRMEMSHDENVIVSKTFGNQGHWPFEISINNQRNHTYKGKLECQRRSKAGDTTFSQLFSTTVLNDNTWHHILYQKSGSKLELYVDGTKEATGDDYAHGNLTDTDTDIIIGARSYGYKQQTKKLGQNWEDNKKSENYIRSFSGSIDEFRIFDSFLTSTQITNLSQSVSNSNRVGNVLYEHGLITITTPSSSLSPKKKYHGIEEGNWSLQFRGTHLVKEHLYICNILDGEYNSTYNVTAREMTDARNDNLKAFTTHSDFNPYITTIGLYGESGDLLAIGKLAQPVKNPDDYDLTLQVRFDTTI